MGAEGAAEAVSDGVAEAAGEVQEAQGVAMVMAALPDPEDTSLDLRRMEESGKGSVQLTFVIYRYA